MSELQHESLPAQQSISTAAQSSFQVGISAQPDHGTPPIQTPLIVFTV